MQEGEQLKEKGFSLIELLVSMLLFLMLLSMLYIEIKVIYKFNKNRENEREINETIMEVARNIKYEIENANYVSCEFNDKKYDFDAGEKSKKIIYVESFLPDKRNSYVLILKDKAKGKVLYKQCYDIENNIYRKTDICFYTDNISDIQVMKEGNLFKIKIISKINQNSGEISCYACSFKKQ